MISDGETQSSTILIAYVPVIHRGYLNFFRNQSPETLIGILTEDITQTYEPLQKDIRSLSAAEIMKSLESLIPDRKIVVVSATQLANFNQAGRSIIMPDEDISRQIATEYLSKTIIDFQSIFLRWDRQRTTHSTQPTPAASISVSELTVQLMKQATELSQQSADWWRQVGALLVKNGEVIAKAVNHHLPNQQQPYLVGDPRANFHKGVQIELSTAIHAEASVIAQAAKTGISVDRAQLYVSTFPCPVCAKLIAESGISEVFYSEGYAMLDGEEILAAKKVKVTAVDLDLSRV